MPREAETHRAAEHRKVQIMETTYLKEALAQYQMQDEESEFIRHNENITCKVAGQYLLRIHKHADGFCTDMLYEGLNRNEIRRSELAFLTHLACRGMRVQQPVPNKDGGFLTIMEDGVCATMLEWIPGHVLEQEEITPDVCREIGGMVAKLHRAAADFCPKEALRYDEDLCERLSGELARGVEKEWMENRYAHIFQEALKVMRDRLRGQKENMIPIHGDLSLTNMIRVDSELVPIDFSLFGYGHPMMDIGELYCCINGVENRAAIAEGYRSLDGRVDFLLLDTCFALSALLYIILHMECCAGEKRFRDNLARWSREIFHPLADGKRLISEDFYMLNCPK